MWQSGIPASKADRLRLEVLQRGGRLPSEVETRSIAAAALKHRRALVALRHVLHLRRSRLPHEHPPTLERTGGTPRLHGFPSWTFSLIAKSALRISSAAFWVLIEISHCVAAASAAWGEVFHIPSRMGAIADLAVELSNSRPKRQQGSARTKTSDSQPNAESIHTIPAMRQQCQGDRQCRHQAAGWDNANGLELRLRLGDHGVRLRDLGTSLRKFTHHCAIDHSAFRAMRHPVYRTLTGACLLQSTRPLSHLANFAKQQILKRAALPCSHTAAGTTATCSPSPARNIVFSSRIATVCSSNSLHSSTAVSSSCSVSWVRTISQESPFCN